MIITNSKAKKKGAHFEHLNYHLLSILIVVYHDLLSIGGSAFSGCESLSSVVIPESVVNLNGNPFCRWNGELKCLSPYFIYDNKVLFNKDKSKIIAFRDENTTSYIIPDGVTSIGDWAFNGCSGLADIVIPDSVTSIGDYAFGDCSSLSSVVIPDSVTSIGAWAFFCCSDLADIVIPNSVTRIGDSAFCDCSSLSSVVIPDSVTSIGAWAFSSCESLTSIIIPDSVTSIGKCAFYDCSSLTNIVIPDGVTSIGYSAFEGCNFPNDIEQELISRFGYKIF